MHNMSFAVTRYLVFGVELLWPIYATLVAMRTTSKSDDNQWLAYWVVHACMSVLEGVAHAVVPWVPLYFELKLVFVLWMTLPQTQGARMIYEDILAPRLAAWERRLRGGPAGVGSGGAAAAAKAGSEREEPAGANAAAALQSDEDRGEGGSSKVKASLRNLFHRTHKSEGAEEVGGGVRGSSGGGGGGGGGGGITAVGEGQEVGGGVRLYSPLSAHLQQS